MAFILVLLATSSVIGEETSEALLQQVLAERGEDVAAIVQLAQHREHQGRYLEAAAWWQTAAMIETDTSRQRDQRLQAAWLLAAAPGGEARDGARRAEAASKLLATLKVDASDGKYCLVQTAIEANRGDFDAANRWAERIGGGNGAGYAGGLQQQLARREPIRLPKMAPLNSATIDIDEWLEKRLTPPESPEMQRVWAQIMLDWARFLSTHPYPPARSGSLARRMLDAVEPVLPERSPGMLLISAATAAEEGAFDEAASFCSQGLTIARQQGRTVEADALARVAESIEAGRAVYDASWTVPWAYEFQTAGETTWSDAQRLALVVTYFGRQQLEAGNQDHAERACKAALSLDPQFAAAHCTLALMRLSDGAPGSALEHFSAAAAGRPGGLFLAAMADVPHRYHLDVIESGLLQTALPLSGSPAAVRNNLAWLLATTRDERVRSPQRARAMAEGLAEESGSYAAWDTLAVCQAAAGDFAKANASVEQAVTLARKQGASAGQQRMLGLRQALFSEGIAFYNEHEAHAHLASLALREGNVGIGEAHLRLASAALRERQRREAEIAGKDFEEMLEVDEQADTITPTIAKD